MRAAILCLLLFISARVAAEGCGTPINTTTPTIDHLTLTQVIENNMVRSTTAETFTPIIRDYLNSRQSAGGLEAALEGIRNVTVRDTVLENAITAQVVKRDLNGDTMPEVIAMVSVNSGAGHQGNLFVFGCEAGVYSGGAVRFVSGWADDGQENSGAPSIRGIEDMTGDGLPEIVISSIDYYPAPFYCRQVFILDAGGRTLGDSGVCQSDAVLRDEDSDGVFELVLPVPGYANSSFYEWSRLDREREDIWAWDGRGFVMTCSHAVTLPRYRIQAIQDGGDALLCGDFAQAIRFYQQAIENDKLLGWSEADNMCPGCEGKDAAEDRINWTFYARQQGFLVPDVSERPLLTAYARYRLVIAYIASGQMGEAQEQYTAITADYPRGVVGYEYAKLATLFWKAFATTADLSAACREVKAVSNLVESPLNRYNFTGVDLGFLARSEESLCPFYE